MTTVNDKLKDCAKWTRAEDDLKKFHEMIVLIKQYPIKLRENKPQAPIYESNTSQFYEY
jgi:hypothetical protein